MRLVAHAGCGRPRNLCTQSNLSSTGQFRNMSSSCCSLTTKDRCTPLLLPLWLLAAAGFADLRCKFLCGVRSIGPPRSFATALWHILVLRTAPGFVYSVQLGFAPLDRAR